jgi:hypothetical protein
MLIICKLPLMNKAEHLTKQLAELSEVINTFSSEAVQLIIIDHILDELEAHGPREQSKLPVYPIMKPAEKETVVIPKKNGATKILNQLLENGFFDTEKCIGELADFCDANYDGPFYTNQLSGLLMTMTAKGKLNRTVSPHTKRYVYTKASS